MSLKTNLYSTISLMIALIISSNILFQMFQTPIKHVSEIDEIKPINYSELSGSQMNYWILFSAFIGVLFAIKSFVKKENNNLIKYIGLVFNLLWFLSYTIILLA